MNTNSLKFYRYPRTQHLWGSNLQEGDEDLTQIPFSQLQGKHIIIEEKVDGSQAGISYSSEWTQQLQSRGHYLTGGPREKEFNILKLWAARHSEAFLDILTDRYIMYGENMFAKHTEFYDNLPHYFMEFDILDTQEGTYVNGEGKEQQGSWLSTPRRWEMLKDVPVVPVLVLFQGKLDKMEDLIAFLGNSRFKTEHNEKNLELQALKVGYDLEKAKKETSLSPLMEGLYIKVEEDGVVKERYKYVRGGFLQLIKNSDSHWHERTIIPNILAEGIDIFS